MWRRIMGRLSRKLRLAAEKKLKEGQVRVLVATASLELGIDVGTVDLAVQINSPRAIAVALQRVGRSGHWRGAIPKGRFFATTRDDLMECAALARAIKHGRSGPVDHSGGSAGRAGAADCGGLCGRDIGGCAVGEDARARRLATAGEDPSTSLRQALALLFLLALLLTMGGTRMRCLRW